MICLYSGGGLDFDMGDKASEATSNFEEYGEACN